MTMQATLHIFKCEYNLCVQAYHNMLIHVTVIVVGSWTCDVVCNKFYLQCFNCSLAGIPEDCLKKISSEQSKRYK